MLSNWNWIRTAIALGAVVIAALLAFWVGSLGDSGDDPVAPASQQIQEVQKLTEQGEEGVITTTPKR
jgi:hypothetical protein